MDACAACAACAKKARVAPPSGHIWTARLSAAVNKETDTSSENDAPLIHMTHGVNCVPNPSAVPSVGPYGRDEGIADRGRPNSSVGAANIGEKRRLSRSPSCEADVVTSTHVEAARYTDRHVANGTPSTNVSPSTHVEAAASSDKQFKDAREKANEFRKQLRRAPPDVRATWDNEIKDLRRNHPKRYAFGISRTTCNTQICLVVTCDCCFVGIHSLSIDFALLAQRP